MIFGFDISAEQALVALIAWNLVWDLAVRPRLGRREIARWMRESGAHELVGGLLRGLAAVIKDPVERQAMDAILRETMAGLLRTARVDGRPPSWKEIVGGAIAERLRRRVDGPSSADGRPALPEAARPRFPSLPGRRGPKPPKSPPWGTR